MMPALIAKAVGHGENGLETKGAQVTFLNERGEKASLEHPVRYSVENSYLVASRVKDNEIAEHQRHSIKYRISIGSQKGKKVFALQTLPPSFDETQGLDLLGKMAGFSLHAGVSAKASQRDKLERLCRYIARPPIAMHRLSLTPDGNIRYELKTPYRDGTTHMVFEPLDFISKLAALIPAHLCILPDFTAYLPQIVNTARPSSNKLITRVITSRQKNWSA